MPKENSPYCKSVAFRFSIKIPNGQIPTSFMPPSLIPLQLNTHTSFIPLQFNALLVSYPACQIPHKFNNTLVRYCTLIYLSLIYVDLLSFFITPMFIPPPNQFPSIILPYFHPKTIQLQNRYIPIITIYSVFSIFLTPRITGPLITNKS